MRPVDPAEVRTRVAAALRADPEASNRAIASRTGASQATVRDVRERLDRGVSELRPGPGRRRRVSKRASAAAAEAAASAEPIDPTLIDAVPDDFAAWFALRNVDDGAWQRFVGTIPLSRVYEVADACRRRATSWRAFATALEDRARERRRSS